jgi:hypothetical protein
MPDPITWRGDLTAACSMQWRGFVAAAERLDEGSWSCIVWRDIEDRPIFLSTTEGIVPCSGDSARRLAGLVMRAHVTHDIDRIADEIALMLDPTRYEDEDLPGMTPEIRAARRRIAERYDELKVKLPFLDSARRARAEVVADRLRRRLQDG